MDPTMILLETTLTGLTVEVWIHHPDEIVTLGLIDMPADTTAGLTRLRDRALIVGAMQSEIGRLMTMILSAKLRTPTRMKRFQLCESIGIIDV